MRATPALAVVTLVLTVAAPRIASAAIVVGVAGPLTGPFAVLGQEMQQGAEAAVADINAAGGVNGQQLTLQALDDRCDAKTADAIANQFAGNGAVMVAGHLCLAASMAAAPVYAGKHIIEISPGTTYPQFTDQRAGPGIFRVAGRDDDQPAVAAALLTGTLAGKAVAFVDDKTTYGKGLADATRQAFDDAGGKEVLTQEIDPGARDYAALATLLRAAAVNVVYYGGSYPEAGLIARAMKNQGMTAVLVGGDALANDDFAATAGDAADGTLMTYPPDPRLAPANAALVTAFRDKGVEPAGYVLPTYAAIEAWADAARAAGSVDFDKVVAALSTGTFDTPLGEISFDAKGDVIAPAFVVYRWQGGTYYYLR